MKRYSHLFLMLGALFLAVACDPSGDASTSTPPEPEKGALTLSYISAHLGSTWDCADQGVSLATEESSKRAASADAGAPAADAAEFADCDGDGCGVALNCDGGRLMLQVENDGAAVLAGLEVTDLILLRADGTELVSLPVESVTSTDGVTQLLPGESTNLLIEFQAPASAEISNEDVLKLRVILVSEDGVDAELVTPEVQVLPMVAT